MPSDSTTLGEFCDQSRKITYGIVQPGKASVGGVPIVRVNNFSGHSLDLSEKLQVAPDVEASYQRSRPKPGDLLISLVGSIGQVAIAPPEIEGWNLARAVGLVPFDDVAKAHWAAYAVQLKENQRFIHQRANTTVQATFNLKDLAEIPIPTPGEDVEDAALRVLRMLDDKIELNRRMNETLEEMARALFRDWFVDFGPTRRQIEGATDPAAIMGQAFSSEAATLAPLFPAKLGDDGLPEGWVQVSAKELATKVQNGGTPSRKNDAYWDNGDIPWLTSGEVRQAFITHTENFITQAGLDGSSAKWVPAGSTVIALYGATAGQVSFTLTKVTTNQAICALLPKDGFRYFLLLAMRSRVADLADSAVGSAQQNISKKIVEDVQLVVPDCKLASQFDGVVAPLFQKIENNLRENQTLAEMRDLLLPKLMSGEIRLKDAVDLE